MLMLKIRAKSGLMLNLESNMINPAETGRLGPLIPWGKGRLQSTH